jgi:mannitol/fructose-specific phosphotransferase system IIA component (Ntr-type)
MRNPKKHREGVLFNIEHCRKDFWARVISHKPVIFDAQDQSVTLVQVLSGLNSVMAAARVEVCSPKSFW